MITNCTFNTQGNYEVLDTYKGRFTDLQLEAEPMLYSSCPSYAYDKGGPITTEVLNRIFKHITYKESQELIKKGYQLIIDTRVALLMPGMSLAIPGWHCDGVIREDEHTQPDITTLNEKIPHYTYSFGGEGTSFIDEDFITIPVDTENVWGSVNEALSNTIEASNTDNNLVKFYRDTLHESPIAKERVWRYWFRMSWYHMPAINKVRKQVQVYTTTKGW